MKSIYEDDYGIEQHNYMCGKNGIKIVSKPTTLLEHYEYGLDDYNIPSISLSNDIIENTTLFNKLEIQSFKSYWLGVLIISFDNESIYYAFSIDEIVQTVEKNINLYLIDNKGIVKKFTLDLIKL